MPYSDTTHAQSVHTLCTGLGLAPFPERTVRSTWEQICSNLGQLMNKTIILSITAHIPFTHPAQTRHAQSGLPVQPVASSRNWGPRPRPKPPVVFIPSDFMVFRPAAIARTGHQKCQSLRNRTVSDLMLYSLNPSALRPNSAVTVPRCPVIGVG